MGYRLAFLTSVKTAKKVTIELPANLVRQAQRATGKGITETIRQGLKLVAAGRAYEKLRTFRGKFKSSINLEELREDRA